MIVHSYYEEDPRVRREAEALAAAGRRVDVVALRKPGADAFAMLEGVTVHRLPVQRHQGAGLGRYLAEYGEFFARATFVAVRLYRRYRHGLVQVHTLPDPLVFAAAPMRLAGVPVLIDLHEAMPEFFRSRFPAASRSVVHAALAATERISIAFASHAMTVNDALADRLVDLGVERSKITVVLNSPRADRFDPGAFPARAFMADGSLCLVYAGALTPLYQLDVVIEAIAMLTNDRPAVPIRLDLFGRGDAETALRQLVTARGLADRVTFHGRIPIDDVPARIAAADAGIAPTRRDEFTDFSLSTKIFEYAAMGKPVVASRLPTVERYFGPEALFYFDAGDAGSLATTLRRLAADGAARASRVAAAAERVAVLSWEREAARYTALVRSLEAAGRPR